MEFLLSVEERRVNYTLEVLAELTNTSMFRRVQKVLFTTTTTGVG